MKLLGFDTSTEVCTAALYLKQESEQVVCLNRYEHAPNKQSELLLPQIDELLTEAGIQLEDLDAIAFGCGPGSFTGVRLGVSVAQGLALGAGVKVIPVSTLAALAFGVLQEHRQSTVMAALDARMGEVYWGLYQYDETRGITIIQDAAVNKPDQLGLSTSTTILGAGPGWDRYHDKMLPQFEPSSQWLADKQVNARAIAELGALSCAAGQVIDAENAMPVYIRDQVANPPAK
jgi:tRNA threonylcarbamoyladenosine biosynthesis protein TsaB